MRSLPLILAHRGASAHAPENTLAAFRLGFEQGADGIELDVHLTRDGRLAVIHDHTLERTTNGTGLAGKKTLAELAKLDAGSWFDSRFAQEKVPALEEVLELCPAGAIVNIELKNGPVFYPRFAEALAETLRSWKQKLALVISSFDHRVLAQVHQADSELPLGLLYEAVLYDPIAYVRSLPYPVQSLHVWHHLATSELIASAHREGLRVLVYTVNHPDDFARAVGAGVDGIITNVPGTYCRK
ncbi:glycerophosphodiester phosphodiesterase [Brevibacillus sp. B_LB10_24]|uniref:glycerophosphodiester phosphodiesterase n=1 Tax=Brevibacillus sp. B_LB10_24 TaxID=3380645 RepID=UPI0038BD1A9F